MTPSLSEVYRSVPVTGLTWWRKLLAFAGPGYLVAVGYMDPGNWATDLAGGSRFGYTLLSVILISNLMAVLLQGLASKLGIVTGRDLAQACRDHYSPRVNFALWFLCEIAIAACDLAEVIGTAIALNLLFASRCLGRRDHAVDADRLYLRTRDSGCSRRWSSCSSLPSASAPVLLFSRSPTWAVWRLDHTRAEILRNPRCLYIAIGILGATVMPHNLYLHSSIVQTRKYDESAGGKKEAVRYAFIDSTIALSFALFINAAILITAAATFHRTGNTQVGEIQDAYELLSPLLGVGAASTVFALALLASGQNSTITGTLAGQIVMEGFLTPARPARRRSRAIAIGPLPSSHLFEKAGPPGADLQQGPQACSFLAFPPSCSPPTGQWASS